MSKRNPVKKRDQGHSHYGCCIALHQHKFRRQVSQDLIRGRNDMAKQLHRRLVGFHQVEIDGRLDSERLHHLIQNLTMLSGRNNQGFEGVRAFS